MGCLGHFPLARSCGYTQLEGHWTWQWKWSPSRPGSASLRCVAPHIASFSGSLRAPVSEGDPPQQASAMLYWLQQVTSLGWRPVQIQDHIAEGPAYFMGGFVVIKQSTL